LACSAWRRAQGGLGGGGKFEQAEGVLHAQAHAQHERAADGHRTGAVGEFARSGPFEQGASHVDDQPVEVLALDQAFGEGDGLLVLFDAADSVDEFDEAAERHQRLADALQPVIGIVHGRVLVGGRLGERLLERRLGVLLVVGEGAPEEALRVGGVDQAEQFVQHRLALRLRAQATDGFGNDGDKGDAVGDDVFVVVLQGGQQQRRFEPGLEVGGAFAL
jgi:hypothetical protein